MRSNRTRYWRCGLWRMNHQPCMAKHLDAGEKQCARHGLPWEAISVESSELDYLNAQWHVPGLSAMEQEARYRRILTNLSRGKPA